MHILKLLGVVLVTAFTTLLVSVFVDIDWVGSQRRHELDLSFNDVAAISMGAAALALGAVALIVTLFAAIGVSVIKKEAVRLAKRSAEEEIQKRLDNTLVRKVDAAIMRELPSRLEAAIAAELPQHVASEMWNLAVSERDLNEDPTDERD